MGTTPADLHRALGLDARGFAAVAALRSAGAEALASRVAVPALVVRSTPGATAQSTAPATPEQSYRRTLLHDDATSADDAVELAAYGGRVAFLLKRPGNPFPAMVSIGRAPNSDIAVTLPSVSKMHGYFLRDGDGWSFTDHRSTNGTQLNGVPIPPAVPTPLRAGDTLRVGLSLVLSFVPPHALAAALL